MNAQPGELRCTITVKRKATGGVETYDLVGTCTPEQLSSIEGDVRRTREHGAAGALQAQVAEVNTPIEG